MIAILFPGWCYCNFSKRHNFKSISAFRTGGRTRKQFLLGRHIVISIFNIDNSGMKLYFTIQNILPSSHGSLRRISSGIIWRESWYLGPLPWLPFFCRFHLFCFSNLSVHCWPIETSVIRWSAFGVLIFLLRFLWADWISWHKANALGSEHYSIGKYQKHILFCGKKEKKEKNIKQSQFAKLGRRVVDWLIAFDWLVGSRVFFAPRP